LAPHTFPNSGKDEQLGLIDKIEDSQKPLGTNHAIHGTKKKNL